MAVHPRICRVATSWPGNFVVDDLVIPLVGAADTPFTAILGTLKADLTACSYAVGVITCTFAPGVVQPGIAVVPSLDLGTATALDVAVDSINTLVGSIGIRFRTMAGGAASPPAVGTGARLVLAIFRPLPYR
jgi:hypothetical protein